MGKEKAYKITYSLNGDINTEYRFAGPNSSEEDIRPEFEKMGVENLEIKRVG